MKTKLWLAVFSIATILTACVASVGPTSQYSACDIIRRDDGPLGGGPEKMTCSSPTGRYIAHIEFLPVPGDRWQGAIKAFEIRDIESDTSYTHSDYSLDFFAWSPDEEYLVIGGSYASIVTTCWTGVMKGNGSTLVYNPAAWGPQDLFVPLGFQDDRLVVKECHSSRCYAIDLGRLPDEFFVPEETEEVSCDRDLYGTD